MLHDARNETMFTAKGTNCAVQIIFLNNLVKWLIRKQRRLGVCADFCYVDVGTVGELRAGQPVAG